jgi:hypothetical protein
MMEAGERALLAETVRDALDRACAPGAPAEPLDSVLDDLGWLDMLHAEPDAAVDIVFHALGTTNASAARLDDVVVHALGGEPRAGLAVLLPQFGTWTPPAHRHDPAAEPDGAHVGGMATARAITADEMLVVHDAGGELRTVTVPIATCAISPIHGIDPHARINRVSVDLRATSGTALDPRAWDEAVAMARRAVAHEMAGASRAMLALARSHALERVQFDRPVARFQAVRHRLADALVAIDALDAALVAAADEPGPQTAALAKAIAGRNARCVAAHCQQVLAGIGFTTDHPFHRFLKRTILLDGWFGTADDIVLDIGRRLLATRHVPTLIEL